MAKVVLGPMVGQASGKIGGIVFSRGRGGTYIRRRAHPTTSTSAFSEAAKDAFANVSGAWGKLAEAARMAWKLYAANNPITDRVGQKITLDGHAEYVRVNAFREQLGEALLSLPPTVGPPTSLATLSVDGAISSGKLLMHFTPTQVATSMNLTLWAAVKESEAQKYVKGSMRFCGLAGTGLVSQVDILALVQARLGTLQNGDVVHVEAGTYDPVSGLKSLPLSASAEISAMA